MQRIVLLLAAEHLDGALKFLLPSDERVVVLVGVVQAGHHLPPAFLAVVRFLVVILILVIEAGQVVVVGIAGHQFAEEVLLPIAEQVRQQIGSIRLLQVEDAFHDVRHVDEVGTRVLYDPVGCCQGLAQLLRWVGHVVPDFTGYLLRLLEEVLQTAVHDVQVYVAVDERHVKLILLQQGLDEVLRHHELVAVLLAHLVHLLKGLIHLLCIVYLHYSSGS